ncbi:outer membrane lipoprotein carrier protein LolA [Salinicola acroporae]|uniref:Outer membrane lipoprotein carrier protein LolA n=1 Tax=Salinicola acroporae TaxID=1541440 RepID=A0ABT6I3G8_9GAMM|nr:outer membrane lipoprotein carrier protein LolA [Salinicola acroporae]MDH4572186.1 hypothetical protein [Salinicola acroporae]
MPFRRWWITLLLLVPLSAQAFDLGDLQRRLAATPSLAGSFEQQRELADLDSSLSSQGTFLFERGKRVVWQLEKPVEERIELTPQAITDGSGENAPPVASRSPSCSCSCWKATGRRWSPASRWRYPETRMTGRSP